MSSATKRRFASVLESNNAMLAAATFPMLKLRWQRNQTKKEIVKGILDAECHKLLPGPVQQPAKWLLFPTALNSSSCSVHNFFFCFEEDDDTFSTVEAETLAYSQTISHNKRNFCEEKFSYSVQCTSWETLQPGNSGTVSKKEPLERLRSLVWRLNLH